MIPFSFYWDTQRQWIGLKWDGLFSIYRERGGNFVKIFGLRFPLPVKERKIRFQMQFLSLKDIYSFISKLRIRKADVGISYPDPVINGILYGLAGALKMDEGRGRVNLRINFLGKNWFRGEITLSLRVIFYSLKRWIAYKKRR